MKVKPKARTSRKGYALPRVLTCGSACSGLYAAGWAMRDIEHHTVFTAEQGPRLRDFIRDNHQCDRIFEDCGSKEFLEEAPYVDFFEMGFPCQPFSIAGRMRGQSDKRCVHNQLFRWVDNKRPRIVLIENVAALAKLKRFKPLFDSLLARLRRMKDQEGRPEYAVFWKVLNSIGWVPQQRKRVFIVAIKLMGRTSVPFAFPTPLKPHRRVQLESIWDESPVLGSYENYPMPANPQSGKYRHIQATLGKICAYGRLKQIDPTTVPVVIDTGGTRLAYTIGHTPCLTASRGGQRAFWSLQRGRELTMSEMCRLQGIPPEHLRAASLSPGQFGHAIGNSFTVPVVRRLIQNALRAAQAAPEAAPAPGSARSKKETKVAT